MKEKNVNVESLNDNELDSVVGGVIAGKAADNNATAICPVCGSNMQMNSSVLQGTYYVCTACGNTVTAGY